MTLKVDGNTDASNTLIEHASIVETDIVVTGSTLGQISELEVATAGEFTPFKLVVPIICSDSSGFRLELETTGSTTIEGSLVEINSDDSLVIVEGVAYGTGTVVPAIAANDVSFTVTIRKGAVAYSREKVPV